ncbi:MAG: hypothetical protein D6696_18305 [Acidobacteria bacterium]|nr:MAG: hypothetical protein D6696_18305 [Acidobacteriota bacterium]
MRRATLGILLLILLGVAAALTFTRLQPWMLARAAEAGRMQASLRAAVDRAERARRGAAERAATSLKVAGDGSLSHWFLTSPALRKEAGRAGLSVQYRDGETAAEQLRKLAAGIYDAVVLPVADYLELGAAVDFPGVIVAALAESRGADAIVALGSPAEGDVVLPATSSSQLLLDLASADPALAGLDLAQRPQRTVFGPREALELARTAGGGLFVLREPELSRALRLPGAERLWGSERVHGYLIDVLIVRRAVIAERPETVRDVLADYFRALDHYAHNRTLLRAEMRQATGLDDELLRGFLERIDFFDRRENRLQLAVAGGDDRPAGDGLIDAIIACTDVMVRSGRLAADPLAGNPYRIVDGGPLAALGEEPAGTLALEPLADEDWAELKPVAGVDPPPIPFDPWGSELGPTGREAAARLAAWLAERPHLRLRLVGHTALGGDEKANLELSRRRARALRDHLVSEHGVAAARLAIDGRGASEPLPRDPGEPERAYRDRLSRVEVIALEARPL